MCKEYSCTKQRVPTPQNETKKTSFFRNSFKVGFQPFTIGIILSAGLKIYATTNTRVIFQ